MTVAGQNIAPACGCPGTCRKGVRGVSLTKLKIGPHRKRPPEITKYRRRRLQGSAGSGWGGWVVQSFKTRFSSLLTGFQVLSATRSHPPASQILSILGKTAVGWPGRWTVQGRMLADLRTHACVRGNLSGEAERLPLGSG
jgi:hypothetical protein